MSIREKLADWISGGEVAMAKVAARGWEMQYAMAKHAAKTFEADAFEWNGKALAAQDALRAILTARNITEARKIAREALGEAE